MDTTEFDEIRPYNDEELPQIFEELIADPAFRKAATGAIPNVPFELLAQKMRACKTKLDFQEAFCYGILWKIAQEHTDSLTLDHSRIPDHNIAYTYMSNHRDIQRAIPIPSITQLHVHFDQIDTRIPKIGIIDPSIFTVRRTGNTERRRIEDRNEKFSINVVQSTPLLVFQPSFSQSFLSGIAGAASQQTQQECDK